MGCGATLPIVEVPDADAFTRMVWTPALPRRVGPHTIQSVHMPFLVVDDGLWRLECASSDATSSSDAPLVCTPTGITVPHRVEDYHWLDVQVDGATLRSLLFVWKRDRATLSIYECSILSGGVAGVSLRFEGDMREPPTSFGGGEHDRPIAVRSGDEMHLFTGLLHRWFVDDAGVRHLVGGPVDRRVITSQRIPARAGLAK